MSTITAILIAVSPGELIDRISIVRLKQQRFTASHSLQHISDELHSLESVYRRHIPPSSELDSLSAELAKINDRLWHLEDEIRTTDTAGDVRSNFAAQARAIYRLNDRRSALKRQINQLLGSPLTEEKQYRGSHDIHANNSETG